MEANFAFWYSVRLQKLQQLQDFTSSFQKDFVDNKYKISL